MRMRKLGLLGAALALAACGSESSKDSGNSGAGGSGGGAGECPEGELLFDEKCRPDPFRHEPEEQLDENNVQYYSDEELTTLELPPPPKSGFRIIMEPQWVEPGEDVYPCQAWEIPPELENHYVYTSVVHTTPGLHHANLYGTEINDETGPQPYPGCYGRADGAVFGQIGGLLSGKTYGELKVPDVLFANSTQVVGREAYELPPGYAFKVTPGNEIVTDVHLQNTTGKRIRVEAAWDFYTMPKELVEKEVAMFVNIWLDFRIPARTQKTLNTTCAWDGGEVAAIMPHMHQWATGFDTMFGTAELYEDGELAGQPVVGDLETMQAHPYHREGADVGESGVQVFSPAVDTNGANAVQFQCHYDNFTDADMCNGFAGHEMCFLFGYVHPPEAQRVAVIPTEGAPCLSLNVNTADPNGTLNILEYFNQSPPEVRDRLLEMFVGDNAGGFFGGCNPP